MTVWDDVYGFDYSCIKDIALREPLVDCVELKSVVSQPCAIKHIDIRTVTKEDLAFKVPFTLKATRNDYVHAFLGWFDIQFSACHKPIQFSTGPQAKYTHWKQTVFYTPETLTVSVSREGVVAQHREPPPSSEEWTLTRQEGDVIKGELTCAPNTRNNRDLDIVIDYEVQGSEAVKGQMTYKMCVPLPPSTLITDRS